MSHVFLSHSTKDNEFTRFLADYLSGAEVSVWVDFDSIDSGERWVRSIQQAVEDCAAIVVVMSRPARDSEWVERETLLAMDKGRPLFIALVEDMPLPLHLINRQFSDFRSPERAERMKSAKKLAVALARTLAGQPRKQPRSLSPEPDRDNFFKYLEQLPGGSQNARIALDLYRWASDNADRIEFGGKVTPGFHVRVQLDKSEVIVFSVWAYTRQPAVQVQFSYLAEHPPYNEARLRRSTLWSLNRLLRKPLMDDQAHRRPTLPLEALAGDSNLDLFKEIMAEMLNNLRSV